MKFYTVQAPYMWEYIVQKGKWVTDRKYYMAQEEYDWMLKQMAERITINNPSHSLIWLWDKKPDLRYSGYGKRGTEMVLLEVELDRSCVLASDFEAWHFVLNNCFLGDEKAEVISKEESWERIFDLDFCQSYFEDRAPILQYVTGEIEQENINFIRKFVCK